MPRWTLPRLPQLLARKLYKTGQTRGADDDEIFQNRVSRSRTVLIPYGVWMEHFAPAQRTPRFENGYIVLISPDDYFGYLEQSGELERSGVVLGQNSLVFYETRAQWNAHDPSVLNWAPAASRVRPLRGQYVARIPATTASDGGGKIMRAFKTTANKGAGIRVYEYASESTIGECRKQLEALFWLCADSDALVVANGMAAGEAGRRKTEILRLCEEEGLLDYTRLREVRVIDGNRRTVCPLCLEELSSRGFFTRMEQAAGREVLDLTVTEIGLFHIEELRPGVFNHRPYNVGWGHHHCNVVAKDAGIRRTLEWMREVLERQG